MIDMFVEMMIRLLQVQESSFGYYDLKWAILPVTTRKGLNMWFEWIFSAGLQEF